MRISNTTGIVQGIKFNLTYHIKIDLDLTKRPFCAQFTTTTTARTITFTTRAAITNSSRSISEAKGVTVKLSGNFGEDVELNQHTVFRVRLFNERDIYISGIAQSINF